MGVDSGTVYSSIRIRLDAMDKDIKDAVAKFDKLEAGISTATGAATKTKNAINGIVQQFTGLSLTGVASFAAVGLAMKKVLDISTQMENAWAAQEEAIAILEATLRATGASAWTSSQELQSMASKLQSVTKYGDETITSMQNVLLGFKSIKGDNFNDATVAILDMATVMKMDLTSAAQTVGKALDDPIQGIGSLRRQGFFFTDDQKKVLEALVATGDKAGAQKIILDELKSTYGGTAEAAGQTGTALKVRLQNAIGDLSEEMGRSITNALTPFRQWLLNIVTAAGQAQKATNDLREAMKAEEKGVATTDQRILIGEKRIADLRRKIELAGQARGQLPAGYVQDLEKEISLQTDIIRGLAMQASYEKAAADAKAKGDAEAAEADAKKAEAEADAVRIMEARLDIQTKYSQAIAEANRQEASGMATKEEAAKARLTAIKAEIDGLTALINKEGISSGAPAAKRRDEQTAAYVALAAAIETVSTDTEAEIEAERLAWAGGLELDAERARQRAADLKATQEAQEAKGDAIEEGINREFAAMERRAARMRAHDEQTLAAMDEELKAAQEASDERAASIDRNMAREERYDERFELVGKREVQRLERQIAAAEAAEKAEKDKNAAALSVHDAMQDAIAEMERQYDEEQAAIDKRKKAYADYAADIQARTKSVAATELELNEIRREQEKARIRAMDLEQEEIDDLIDKTDELYNAQAKEIEGRDAATLADEKAAAMADYTTAVALANKLTEVGTLSELDGKRELLSANEALIRSLISRGVTIDDNATAEGQALRTAIDLAIALKAAIVDAETATANEAALLSAAFAAAEKAQKDYAEQVKKAGAVYREIIGNIEQLSMTEEQRADAEKQRRIEEVRMLGVTAETQQLLIDLIEKEYKLRGDQAGMKKIAENTATIVSMYEGMASVLSTIWQRQADEQIAAIERVQDAEMTALDLRQTAQKDALDAELQERLYAEGLASAATLEQYRRDLEVARESGTRSEIIAAETALRKAEIEEEYATRSKELEERLAAEKLALEDNQSRERARIEYEAETRSWGLKLLSATANAALGITNALAAYPFSLPNAISAGFAGASAVAVVAAQKPRQTYETGGIVPGASYSGDKIHAGLNSGEMVLTAAQQKRLFDIAAGGKQGAAAINATIIFELSGERVAQETVRLINDGVYTIDAKRGTR